MIEEIRNRLEVGYTLSVYGTRKLLYEQMEEDISSLLILFDAQKRAYEWKYVSELEPPKHIDLLVKSPNGIIHLASWRAAYNIFTVQEKSESSYDWQWKQIG